jgi:hypothetical protein
MGEDLEKQRDHLDRVIKERRETETALEKDLISHRELTAKYVADRGTLDREMRGAQEE